MSGEQFDSQYIISQYLEQNRSAADIARELGCCEKTISSKLRQARVPTKRRTKQDLTQDLTGRTFGRLVVLCSAGTDHLGNRMWWCQCKCGSQKGEQARVLLRKDCPVRSCGCARRKNCDWSRVPPYVMATLKCKAANRGIEVKVSLAYCNALFEQQAGRCALSGLPLSFGRRRDVTATTASLDRIDSSLPYEEGNVQWVHKKINLMKNSLSDEEFVSLCRTVSEHNRRTA